MKTLPSWYRKLRTKTDASPPGETAVAAPPSPSERAPAVSANGAVKSEAAPAEATATSAPAAEPIPAPPAAAGPPNKASRLLEVKRRTVPKLVRTAKAAYESSGPWQRPAVATAAIMVAAGLGYAGGVSAGKRGDGDLAAQRVSEAASDIRQSREETMRLAAEMKYTRVAVDALKGERDRARADLGRQAQLSERVEKTTSEAAGRIGKLAEQLDRIEKTQRDPARIASLMDRLDRIERQMQTASLAPQAGAPTPPPKPVAAGAPLPDVATTGSLQDPKPPAKPVETDHRKIQLEGYVLRDIEDGLALIEGRNGRYFEVSPGMSLPGLGRVEAIERRGRQWVVVTPKGFIAER